MKKLIVVLCAGAMALGGSLLAPASADPIEVEGVGSATVNEGGYTLLLDGDQGNPDPFDGYAGVDADGNAQCADEGDGYEYTDNNGDGDTDDEGEKTAADDGCDPSA